MQNLIATAERPACRLPCDLPRLPVPCGPTYPGLRRRGIDAHVFEAAPKLRNETSTMISLGPNAWVALQELHPDLPADLRYVARSECVWRAVAVRL